MGKRAEITISRQTLFVLFHQVSHSGSHGFPSPSPKQQQKKKFQTSGAERTSANRQQPRTARSRQCSEFSELRNPRNWLRLKKHWRQVEQQRTGFEHDVLRGKKSGFGRPKEGEQSKQTLSCLKRSSLESEHFWVHVTLRKWLSRWI